MKKLLFAILLFVGLVAAAPVAEAGQFARVYTDRGVLYVPKAAVYSPYYDAGCYGHRRHYRHSHAYRYSDCYRPSYRTSYNRPYPSCRSGYYARPRVAISFGF